MLAKIDDLCVQRDELRKNQQGIGRATVVKMQELRWYDPSDNPPWSKPLRRFAIWLREKAGATSTFN
jgi:hypothetical protein